MKKEIFQLFANLSLFSFFWTSIYSKEKTFIYYALKYYVVPPTEEHPYSFLQNDNANKINAHIVFSYLYSIKNNLVLLV